MKKTRYLLLPFVLIFSVPLQGQSPKKPRTNGSAEQKTARHFESLRKYPPQMFAFLKAMPKGADLHNHLSGSTYAESFVDWSAKRGLCVSQTTYVVSSPPCDQSGLVPISAALTDNTLYRRLIDAWSMRNWKFSGENGHDDFFDSFARFGAASFGQFGPMLAEVSARAARGNVSYLELMLTPDQGASNLIAQKIGWDGNAESTLNKLTAGGIAEAVAAGIKALKDAESEKDKLLKCGTSQADPGCAVTVRYIAQVARADTPARVFAQMVTGLELASDANSKVVAINLVQPEDWLPAIQNFSLQMDMLNFLHQRYPKAHITLHAGELTTGMVPPEALSFHIRDSVIKGHAERIGHGVSIMYETDPYGLLRELASKKILIEICLSSNDLILGLTKEQHALATYIQFGVPVALGTDDEGVSRSEISQEFFRAATEHELGYLQLKKMARTSLEYAFLPGPSLWSDANRFVPVPACASDVRNGVPSRPCKEFLEGSVKAKLQIRLEDDFRRFERNY